MKKVSVLLVESPNLDTSKIASAFKDAGLDYTLYFAGSGKNALDILMGDPYHELIASDADKIKPNAVILSKELTDFSALDFLSIVSKYYSLKDIKIFLLSDSLTAAERLIYQEHGVSGYLQRPLDKEQVLKQINPLLSGGQIRIALMPLALFGTKLAEASVKVLIRGGVGAKIAASVSVLMISSAAIYNANNETREDLSTGTVKTSAGAVKQVVMEVPASPSSDEQESSNKREPAPQKPVELSQNSMEEISNASSILDPEVSSQKNESSVQRKEPNSLRIIVLEEPDSIPN